MANLEWVGATISDLKEFAESEGLTKLASSLADAYDEFERETLRHNAKEPVRYSGENKILFVVFGDPGNVNGVNANHITSANVPTWP